MDSSFSPLTAHPKLKVVAQFQIGVSMKFSSPLALLLVASALFAADAANSPDTEIARLQAALATQQQQIDALQQTLRQQQELLQRVISAQRPSLGEVASLSPIIPIAPIAALAIQTPVAAKPNTQSDSARIDAVQKTMEGINSRLGGFKFSGDFRFRLDEQLRKGNAIAGPLQNSRGRYRVRFNIDKDIIPGVTAHVQLSTAPFTNETTNDQDFAGFGIKAPFSIAEAWIKYTRGNLTLRAGRMDEVFADNQRFVWDDDVRLNGVEARYNAPVTRNISIEARAAEYILSNPNTPIVAAGSPYLAIGYRVGQKVRDATLFHSGVIVKMKTGKWVNQLYYDTALFHNADQIQLASTAAGYPVLAGNAVGITLSGPIGQTGNAVTTAGGAMYTARHWDIVKGGFRTDYADMHWGKTSMPFWVDFQALGNAGADGDNKAFMASINAGQVRKFKDMRFLYQYSWKQANSLIAQFTDDDLGTQTGVNTRVSSLRFDLGLTKFLQWQNIFFIQDPIAANKPGFFVPVQKGANTTYRFLGHLAFTF